MRQRRKWFKKVMALILCIGMLSGMFDSVLSIEKCSIMARAAGGATLEDLQRKFPGGKYWNHYVGTDSDRTIGVTGEFYSDSVSDYPCNTHNGTCPIGGYDCNKFNGIQCNGFVRKISYEVYGSVCMNWKTTSLNNIKAGDVMHYFDSQTSQIYGHWVMIIGVNGDTLTVGEANASGEKEKCKIRWDRTINKTTIWNTKVYAAPYTLPVSSGTISTSNESVDIRATDYYFAKLGETSFKCRADFKNPQGKLITELGMELLDENENIIGTIKENEDKTYGVGSHHTEKYIFYDDVAKELGFSLTPGTTYKYRFYITVSGAARFYSPTYTVKMEGNSTPNTPSLSTDTTHVAAGKTVTVKWNADSNATNGYDITVTKTDGSYTRTTNVADKNASSAMVVLPSEGSYQITAIAKGTSKNSAVATLAQTITAHGQSKVTFVQNTESGEEVLKTEMVTYGENATAPQAPSKEGYTFQGWDKSYTNVTSDLTVTANYKINTYTVKFVDEDGTVLKEEKATYKSAVQPPADPTSKKEGYIFAGWNNNDYTCVKANTTVTASYAWENPNLPIIVKASKCEFKDTGYQLTYDITNNPDTKTTGRAIVSLKTSTGKLVATTESNAFTLEKNATKTAQEIFIPYEGVASTVEIVIVDSFSSGIPISENASCAVSREWSQWVETEPEGNYEIESRTEYRYKDKVTTTSSASSLAGWTQYNTTWAWSDWGNWSSWTRDAVGASDSRQVETQNVTDSNAYTNYKYYYWRRNRDGNLYSYNQYANYTYYEYNTSSPLAYCKTVDGINGYVAHSGYINFSNELWFLASTTNVPATSHTEWRYRDRSQIYTYYYYKWNDWSSWTADAVAANDNRQVETRTTYRYKANLEGQEDNSGTLREVTGSVPTEFAGKQATLLVYKNEEAADYNNEYVGQQIINDDGTFHFSFYTREEPSAQTGDFTVDLALEGASDSIYVKTIKAPLPKYTVTFVDWDGTELSKQEVTQGETAVLPDNPTREHYRFTGWDTGNTNVRDDLIITAQYEKETYTVVWVDWSRQNFAIDTYTYDEELSKPALPEVEGYELTGWVDENGETPEKVTRNLVLTAEYKIKEYTVKFYDWEGNVINTQIVEYGKSALIPESPVKEGMIFDGWSNSGYICVKENLDIYPSFSYLETTENPTVNMVSGAYEHSFDVQLSGEEGAVICYTTDGSTPDQYSSQYNGKISIDKNTVLQFVAFKDGKNASEIQKAVYLISETEDNSGALKIKKSSWDMIAGNSATFEYTLLREDGNKDVQFFSLDDSVASINDSGELYAVASGSTQIFAVTKDLKYADFCTVNVTSDEILVSGMVLEESIMCISPKQSTEIEVTVEPANATYQEVTWYSSDNDIVQVDEAGKITGKSLGTTSVRGYSYTGNCYIDCTVVVAEPFVGLCDTAVALEQGEELQEEAYIIGGMEQEFTWNSEEPEIATVDETGLIKAVAPGQTTITYTSEDGQYTASMIVIVTEKKEEKVTLEQCAITAIEDVTYTGKEITPEIEVNYNGKTLKQNEDYSVVFNNNVNAGVATVYVIGKGNYTGMAETTFSILPLDITSVTITPVQTQKYDGSALTPVVTAKNGKVVLSEGIDYTITYENNVNPGTATYTLTGTGNYTSFVSGTFAIETVISDTEITPSQPTGQPTTIPTDVPTTTPEATVTEIPEVTDIPTITETPIITDIPTATVVPTITETPTITVAPTIAETPTVTPPPTNTPTATAKPSPTKAAVVTKKTTPTPTVKVPGKPSIKSVKNTGKKKMVVKLKKKVKGAAGYQIVYATNKKFTQNKKTVTTKSTSKTISKLKKGKTYYVKVRAYTKDSKGKKIYGKYSGVKKVKIKK